MVEPETLPVPPYVPVSEVSSVSGTQSGHCRSVPTGSNSSRATACLEGGRDGLGFQIPTYNRRGSSTGNPCPTPGKGRSQKVPGPREWTAVGRGGASRCPSSCTSQSSLPGRWTRSGLRRLTTVPVTFLPRFDSHQTTGVESLSHLPSTYSLSVHLCTTTGSPGRVRMSLDPGSRVSVRGWWVMCERSVTAREGTGSWVSPQSSSVIWSGSGGGVPVVW